MSLVKVNNRGQQDNLGRRNILINGAMNIAQRGTSFASAGNGVYNLDRFLWYDTGAGVVTISQDTDTPNGNFKYSMKHDVTTADASLAAGDLYCTLQHIEGLNSAKLGWGSSDAKTITVSFWVKSPKTGIHCIGFQNNAQDRTRVEEYTVSSANTWEHKSITVPGDTSGTWLTTTGLGIRICWTLAAGSTFTKAAGSWGAGNVYASPNQVNCMDNTSNNFYITGLQLEEGSVATDFEHLLIGEELALCQRYCYQHMEANGGTGSGNSTEDIVCTASCYDSNTAYGIIQMPVTMRVAPTLDSHGGTNYWKFYNNGGVGTFNTFTIINATRTSVQIYNGQSIGLTAGQSGNFQGGNTGNYMRFIAEL